MRKLDPVVQRMDLAAKAIDTGLEVARLKEIATRTGDHYKDLCAARGRLDAIFEKLHELRGRSFITGEPRQYGCEQEDDPGGAAGGLPGVDDGA